MAMSMSMAMTYGRAMAMAMQILRAIRMTTNSIVLILLQGQDIDHYIVEYYRDQWQLWLRQ